ncbi:dienelactone hydrolase family protein [Telmatocola sphagniphila]|jgi:dienelactone hydrolase|uniref:Dienelactone hydrolase family protein n=1 Tax=Telmatocola sphagniphila TaxID=1123043 RepID=A0A8E6B4N2_9BACT|nr:dienelactone hydrolase family protein [Telmatocola sphagniphila]QVL30438.1 dienelactone hydrolase family protein [Telmatocola sphagniphila]
MKQILSAMVILFGASLVRAEVKTRTIEYTYEGTKLVGFLAYDDAHKDKKPGVLVVHEWWGLNDYAKERAKALAKLGYVAFCPDMYGEGATTEHPEDAGKMSTLVRNNVKIWQGRANAGLKILASQPEVDSSKLAAIGYCFGGSTALELAYSGANLKAVCTFHAGLPTPSETDAKAIKAKVLVCNGADDTFVSAASIKNFKAALTQAGVDLQFENYPGAVHSFTVAEADKRKLPGMAYNKAADEKSWQQMQDLFHKVFAK